MKFYRINLGTHTIVFDSLDKARQYAESYFQNRGVIVGIEEVKEGATK